MTEIAESTPLLARQPIVDADGHIKAYELLYRSGDNTPNNYNGDQLTSIVIDRLFGSLSIQELLGKHKGFINFTTQWINSPPPLPKHKFVIELLENIKMTPNTIKVIKKLKHSGFNLALDDVVDMSIEGALPYVDVVKVDIAALSHKKLISLSRELKKHSITLLAEKVETREEFSICHSLGFTLFQGYFFCKPEQVNGQELLSNQLVVSNLISKIQDKNISIKLLENLIKQDPSITYKLLNWANSSTNKGVKEITSIKDAIVRLGLQKIKSLTTILMLSNLTNKPAVLMQTALMRAFTCEWLAINCLNNTTGSYFLAGLLSMTEALFNQPTQDVLNKMTISQTITQAVISFEGDIGLVLSTVILYERANWNMIRWPILKKLNITSLHLTRAHQEAIKNCNGINNIF